jgi:hypothetical protein
MRRPNSLAAARSHVLRVLGFLMRWRYSRDSPVSGYTMALAKASSSSRSKTGSSRAGAAAAALRWVSLVRRCPRDRDRNGSGCVSVTVFCRFVSFWRRPWRAIIRCLVGYLCRVVLGWGVATLEDCVFCRERGVATLRERGVATLGDCGFGRKREVATLRERGVATLGDCLFCRRRGVATLGKRGVATFGNCVFG